MEKEKNFVLRGNPDLFIECPEQKSGEVRKRLLQNMRTKKKRPLEDEKKRMRIKAMCLQKN